MPELALAMDESDPGRVRNDPQARAKVLRFRTMSLEQYIAYYRDKWGCPP
jgi:hypothetical protein